MTPPGKPVSHPGADEQWQPSACAQEPTIADVRADPVAGSPSDYTLTSFDGTPIRIHWFPADGAGAGDPRPTILMGPGWSQPGDSNPDADPPPGAVTIKPLREHGYNVLTWDPRGFGESGGRAHVDGAAFEGRDAQALLDWVARQPAAALDRDGDPRAGMVGGSYGGGIQLILAAIDCRVDVITPTIAWHSLQTSLYKAGISKTGWSRALNSLVSPDDVDPHVVRAYLSGQETGTIGLADQRWFARRGPGRLVDRIRVPTLLLQGTVDTLFTPNEAIVNYRIIRGNGVPVKMLWFCGGHGVCLTEPGDVDAQSRATFDWLARYLDGDTTVDTGPRFETVDQGGSRWTAGDYPVPGTARLSGRGSGRLMTDSDVTAGPITDLGPNGGLGGLVAAFTPAPVVDGALEVDLTADVEGVALGIPRLHLEYSGQVPAGAGPHNVFAQLVDEERGVVVGNQITPIRLQLDGEQHTVTVGLEAIAQHLASGDSLTLQLVPSTVAYFDPGLGVEITFDAIEITIPIATDLVSA